MNVRETDLPGVIIVEPRLFDDDRGRNFEMWNRRRYGGAGLADVFEQSTLSRSRQGVVRGMHFQHGQAKLVTIIHGELLDVVVDIRPGSPTFRRFTKHVLSDRDHRQIFIPPGFAHGYWVTSASVAMVYELSTSYDPSLEHGIRWNDPELAIDWPGVDPVLSEKDASSRFLREFSRDELPAY